MLVPGPEYVPGAHFEQVPPDENSSKTHAKGRGKNVTRHDNASRVDHVAGIGSRLLGFLRY